MRRDISKARSLYRGMATGTAPLIGDLENELDAIDSDIERLMAELEVARYKRSAVLEKLEDIQEQSTED